MEKRTRQKLIGIPILGLIITLVGFWEQCLSSVEYFVYSYSITTLITACVWTGNIIIFDYLHSNYGKLEQTASRTILVVAATTLFTALTYTLLKVLHGHYFGKPCTLREYLVGLRVSFIVTTIVALFYEVNFFFHQWKKATLDAERLKKETVQAQLEALRNQVNPHFLFNSLNTLTSIIPEDTVTAVDFTQKLSNVFRYLLSTREKELVTLESETDFIKSYLFLLKVRFEESLDVQLDIPSHKMDRLLPPISVQLLIENAIKHNIASKDKPLRVSITTEENYLKVSNNLQTKQQMEKSTGVGLENIQKRYSILADQNAQVINTGKEFIVLLPLLAP